MFNLGVGPDNFELLFIGRERTKRLLVGAQVRDISGNRFSAFPFSGISQPFSGKFRKIPENAFFTKKAERQSQTESKSAV